MICPRCHAKNKEGVLQCNNCGTSLRVKNNFNSISGIKTVVNTDSIEDILKKGSVFAGRYEIMNDGLKGGMGAVYKVKDNTLEKIKALKIILPAYLANEKVILRFKQEVAISQELLHENIVRVYDIGESDGILFFTMEWVDGISLRDFINERKKDNHWLSMEEVIYFSRQLCSALSYAHKTIIHRDIKPENILIIDSHSSTPKIKITDFGIAKMESQAFFVSQSSYMGTPIYMAPEQYTDASHVDKRADIYSLGVVLYELMTFRHPIGTFPMPSEVNPLLAQHKHVDNAIRKALNSDRAKRYADVLDIIRELETPVVQKEKAREKIITSQPSELLQIPDIEKPLEQPGIGEIRRTGTKRSKAIYFVAITTIVVVLGLLIYGKNIFKSDEKNHIIQIVGDASGSKPQGEAFFFTGTNFSPNSSVTWHIKFPDISEGNDKSTADGNGYITWKFQTSCDNMIGNYTLWAEDTVTGKTSNRVIKVVTADPGCPQTPPPPSHIQIAGERSGSKPQGAIFSLSAINCTPNSTVTWHIKSPSGEQTEITAADGNGKTAWNFRTSSANPPGTYTLWAEDNATGRKSDMVALTVTKKVIPVVENRPPNSPVALAQYSSDGRNQISPGGYAPYGTVIFKGMITDPDNDSVSLQVELRKCAGYASETTFTGNPNYISDLSVPSARTASVRIDRLMPGLYKWKARTVDSRGNMSKWVSYDGNDYNTDFKVSSGGVVGPPEQYPPNSPQPLPYPPYPGPKPVPQPVPSPDPINWLEKLLPKEDIKHSKNSPVEYKQPEEPKKKDKLKKEKDRKKNH